MRKIIFTGLVALVAISVLVSGCGDPNTAKLNKATERFGAAMDAQREALSIPPIPKDTSASLSGENSLSWTTGDARASHMAKTLTFKEDISAPILETDQIRCKAGMLLVKTFYGEDGKSVTKQVFMINGKTMPTGQGWILLKEVLQKEAVRLKEAVPIEDDIL